MSQDVEMKAYQMVEEMLTEKEIEGVPTTEIPFLKKLAKLYLQKLSS